MRAEPVKIPTDKQYLYYLIISQLYNDGHMEAAMRLEMSVLDTAGQVAPSNRLSSILSACLLSFNDVAEYITHRNRNGKQLTPPPPPASLSHLSNLTRKRLHSGPPSLFPTSTTSSLFPESSPLFPTGTDSSPSFTAPNMATSQVQGKTPTVLLDTSTVQETNNITPIQSQLSKELEEICNAASQDFRSTSLDMPALDIPTNEVPVVTRDLSLVTRDIPLVSQSSALVTRDISLVTRDFPQPTRDVAMETQGQATSSAPVSPEEDVRVESATDFKVEMEEIGDHSKSGTSTSSGGSVSSPSLIPPAAPSLLSSTNDNHTDNTTDSPSTDPTQILLDNLSNIASMSEMTEITELTQSLVDSLVQGNASAFTSDGDNSGEVTCIQTESMEMPVTVTSPTKELLIDNHDGAVCLEQPVSAAAPDCKTSPRQLVTLAPLQSPPESYQQLSLYKHSSSLLNFMGNNRKFSLSSRNKPFRRHRTRFNDEQVAAMERYYNTISRYARPDNGLPDLIRETGLTHDTIMLWFQNKRARDKRKGWDDPGPGNHGPEPGDMPKRSRAE